MSDLDRKNNNENLNLMSESSAPDLHINIKGVPFHLHKEMLAKRSSKVSLLLERNEIDELRLFLREIEADPETFELIVRFCYGYEKLKFSSDNIVSVLCIAYYLGMTDEHSSNNLLGKASEFLEVRVLPCWNETVIALRSGTKSLDKLADVGLVDLFFDTLIEKASYDPRLLDLITIPLRLYEPLMILAVKSSSIPAEYIVSSVCKYAKKWVFDSEERFLGQKKEAIEAVERLLPHKRGLITCEFLFESLKHSIWLEASSECRNGFEIRISKQVDMAKPKDLKILSRGYGEKAESFEDIKLVKTVVTSFYSYYENQDSEDVSHFVKVAKLLEEFLVLAASEVSLKLEAFVELAEMAVASSQGILTYSDGIYRGIDVFLESHRYLTESEKMEVCKVLECSKLSQEGCEQAGKNQRLPLRIVVQVLFASQLQIRDTVAKEIKGIEEKVDEEEGEEEEEEIGVWSDEDEMEKMSNKLLGLEIENHECVVHRLKKKTKKKKKKKTISVWRQVKRKFGCLTSPSSVDASCTCDVKKTKKKKIHHFYK
ncbi:BTB/POZ domain-containing protein [Cardamine amara subsp. amara]|uniref:BTB/POZ domain-containing protein n=1 Tax=Cardamine amara subsp. amara TaxID=228776 RepID=A0ABD0ZLF5_CARAN